MKEACFLVVFTFRQIFPASNRLNNMINKYLTSLLVLAFIIAPMTPSFAFAKEKAGKKAKVQVKTEVQVSASQENKNKNKNENEEVKKIPPGICKLMKRGFIPPGWAKNWFNVDAAANRGCLPSSGVSITTPPVDTTAPIISNISSNLTGNSFAVITWDTNEKAKGKIYWSLSSPVSTSTASSVTSWEMGNHHFAVITGLTAGTNYKALIEIKDKAGNTGYSGELGFTTTGTAPVTPDTTAPIISSIVTAVGTSTINVFWQTNEASDSRVFYGTSTPLNTLSAAFVLNSSLVTSHSMQITGLATGTPYYLILISKDSALNTATSSQFSTTTLSN